MRSIWKGSLAFGLVNVPVKVYSATEDHDVRFHQVHRADGGRIRYQRVCEADGKEVEYADIAKAYEADDGRTVVLTDEDFDQLPANNGHEIEVLSFVPADQIDPVLFDRSYYLEPEGRSAKAYVLLRRTLEKTDRIAVVHFALRQKTRLAALRVRDEVLVVQTLLWPDEVRKASFPALDKKIQITPTEMKMAGSLVDSFAADFDPTEYTDDYRAQLEQLIEAKLEGGEAFEQLEPGEDEGQDAEVVDLLAALKRSVERHRSGGGGMAATKKAAAGHAATTRAAGAGSKRSAGKTRTARKSGTATSGTAKSRAKSGTPKASTAKASTAKSAGGKSRTSRTKSA